MLQKTFLTVILVLILTNCTQDISPLPRRVRGLKLLIAPKKKMSAINSPMSCYSTDKLIDWTAVFSPMIHKMMVTDLVRNGSLILVNQTKNDTNGNLHITEATKTLTDLLMKGKKGFQVVSSGELCLARHALGLSLKDNLETRTKSVVLAHYLKAQYILLSSVTGDILTPTINLQLMTVNTGEIVWSCRDPLL